MSLTLAGAGAAASGAAGAGAAGVGAATSAAGVGASAATLGSAAQIAGRIPAALYPITIPVMMLVVYGSEYVEDDKEKSEKVATKSIIEKRRERLAAEKNTNKSNDEEG